MDYRKLFLAKPGKKIKLADIDPGYHGKHITEAQAKVETEKYCATISSLQDLMYSEGHHSLLIVLQAMDAGGKDGTVRHAMSTMNPIGTIVNVVQTTDHRRPEARLPLAGSSACPRPRPGRHLQPLALRRRAGGARAQPRP